MKNCEDKCVVIAFKYNLNKGQNDCKLRSDLLYSRGGGLGVI